MGRNSFNTYIVTEMLFNVIFEGQQYKQHLPSSANQTLRDGELTPFKTEPWKALKLDVCSCWESKSDNCWNDG